MGTPAGTEQEEWEDVGQGELLDFKTPVTVIGLYQGVERIKSKFSKDPDGKQDRHALLVEGPDGEKLVHFFAPSILARKLKDPRISVGTMIRIEFTGETVKTDGGPAKVFNVGIRSA